MAAPIIGLGITAAAIGGIVKVALRAIGVGIISFAGGAAMIASLQALIIAQVSASDSAVLGVMGLARVDEAFNILIMFLSLRLTISGGKRLGLI